MPTLQAETLQEIASFSSALLTKFSPPEFISGCRVIAVTDINEYATNNGWIEALCGQHNQQRVRWKSGETIGTTNYIDVIHFPAYHLFEAWGIAGTAAISPSGGGWGFDHTWRVSLTNTDADFSDIQTAIDDAGTAAGDVILLDPDTYSPADTILINKAISVICLDPYGATINFSASNKPAIKITAGGKVVNLNVIHSGAGNTAAALELAANGAIAENCIFTASGAATNGFGIFQSAGTQAEIRNCQAYESNGVTLKAGFYNTSGTSATIYGGLFSGDGADIENVSGATLELLNLPKLVNSRLTNAGTFSGLFQGSSGNVAVPEKVKNTSGGAVTPGQMGYTTWVTGSGLEFKTTTTANDNRIGAVACVIVGNANNADIYVTDTGRHTIPYAGTAPNAGEFLVFSTTAGSVLAQAYMSPDVFAVAMAAGSSGKVDAELRCKTSGLVQVVSDTILYACNSHGDTDFTATINGAPSATSVVYNAPSAGNEESIRPSGTPHLGYLRLYNSTRGTYRLVAAVNTTTNTITTVSTADAWASGDTITAASPTVVIVDAAKWIEIDLSQQTTIPVLARSVVLRCTMNDSGAASLQLALHPYETYNANKQSAVVNPVTGQNHIQERAINLINQRFCYRSGASGAGTMTSQFRLGGYFLATP